MDFNEINTLLSIVHMANDVDPWYGEQARRRLNEIKSAATKPVEKPIYSRPDSSAAPKSIPTSAIGERKI